MGPCLSSPQKEIEVEAAFEIPIRFNPLPSFDRNQSCFLSTTMSGTPHLDTSAYVAFTIAGVALSIFIVSVVWILRYT